MVQRTRIVLFEESIDWVQLVGLVLIGVLAYALACFILRRRAAGLEGAEREYPPPNPDAGAFGAIALADVLIRFVTLRITSFFFSTLYGGAIPLNQAIFISAFSFLLFLLCSFVITVFVSKALLPTGFRQAALIGIIKVSLQLMIGGLFFLLLIVYAVWQQGGR
jgi:hypothetical protein